MVSQDSQDCRARRENLRQEGMELKDKRENLDGMDRLADQDLLDLTDHMEQRETQDDQARLDSVDHQGNRVQREIWVWASKDPRVKWVSQDHRDPKDLPALVDWK